MVSPEKIEQKMRNLGVYTEKLSQLASSNKNDFLADFTKVNSAKYLLLESIESCLDMSNHIISSEKLRAPRDYSDMFVILAEKKILPPDFCEELKKMAKFRNRLVHLYWDISDETIYDILTKNLSDFDRFAKYILAFLEKNR